MKTFKTDLSSQELISLAKHLLNNDHELHLSELRLSPKTKSSELRSLRKDIAFPLWPKQRK